MCIDIGIVTVIYIDTAVVVYYGFCSTMFQCMYL